MEELSKQARADLRAVKARADSASDLLKKVANPNRLVILCALAEGELSVSELQKQLSVTQGALSQHLAILREAGLVETRREGLCAINSLAGDRAMQIIDVLRTIYCKR